MRRPGAVRAFLLAAGVALAAVPGLGAEAVCAGHPATIDAPAAFVPQICRAFDRAETLLAPCGLVAPEAVHVRVVERFDGTREAHEACAALFECATGTLTVLHPDALRGSAAIRSFGDIPVPEYFESLIVHELTHGRLHATAGDTVTVTAHEYLAYAMQVAALPEATREGFLARRQEPVAAGLAAVNMLTLFLQPDGFAAAAHGHFAQPGVGCAFVARILAGDPDLPYEFVMPDPDAEKGP